MTSEASSTKTPEPSTPVFVAYYPENFSNSPREVYRTLKDATKFVTSPEGKTNGARFKRFGTPQDALRFLAAGDALVSPRRVTDAPATPSEPVIPFPSLTRIQMNDLKRAIDKGNLEVFNTLVESNPRYIVNSSGDVASIVMEGFRYNALHIAAKAGQVEIIRSLLEHLHDLHYLTSLYATNEEDVVFRQRNIIDSYLNTPDKGNCDTPLHLASKFGKVDVVEVLCAEKLLDRNVMNKEGVTPVQVAAARYNEADKSEVKKKIELLLQGYYVALYKVEEQMPKIVVSQSFPELILGAKLIAASPNRSSEFRLSAYIGLFPSLASAEDFQRKWLASGREIKRSDPDKGYERVGRELQNSTNFRLNWAETWSFLPEVGPFDAASDSGLAKINEYFIKESKRRRSPNKGAGDHLTPSNDPVRRKLLFDEEVEEEEETFYDAEDVNEYIDNFLNDSLASLGDRFASMSLSSPVRRGIPENEVDEDVVSSEDLWIFETPPSSPPATYVADILPTKVDNDLFLAISTVPKETLQKYPMVDFFVDKLERIGSKARSEWPMLDSPRHVKTPRKSRFL
ncbi:unnamed protein product [Caenorhabditis auriculariae]|uniref:ANKLE2 third alpha/beta domain-containing protein n=1 Tax=Caenorhabditis auriculariae TaxID=2777116 RepID=A0A8S1HNF6_9PELO|nr:unnamed protein product [Caenorhabditis auriculariae]